VGGRPAVDHEAVPSARVSRSRLEEDAWVLSAAAADRLDLLDPVAAQISPYLPFARRFVAPLPSLICAARQEKREKDRRNRDRHHSLGQDQALAVHDLLRSR